MSYIINTMQNKNVAMVLVSDEESVTTKQEMNGENVFTSVQQLKPSRSMRALDFTAAVACVACVLTLVACGFTVHMYVQIQTRVFREEVAAMVREELRAERDRGGLYTDNQEGNYAGDVLELTAEDESIPKRKRTAPEDKIKTSTPGLGKRPRKDKTERDKNRNKKNKQDKCCRKIQKELGPMIEEAVTAQLPGLINKTVEKAVEHIQGSNADSKHLIGVDHYMTVVDEDFILREIGKFEAGNPFNRSLEMPEWKGTLYRNRSLRIQEAPTTLKMFAPTTPDNQRLFDFAPSTGLFKARYSGLYHIYAHVPFHVDESGRSDGDAGDVAVVLVHTRYTEGHARHQNALRCQESTRTETARTITRGHPYEASNQNITNNPAVRTFAGT